MKSLSDTALTARSKRERERERNKCEKIQ